MTSEKTLLILLYGSLLFMLNVSEVNAHDSHSHSAPWQACEDKQKDQQCSYTNGDDDLFKGSCQSFSEALMCVRNQPIIHAVDSVNKEQALNLSDSTNDKVNDPNDEINRANPKRAAESKGVQSTLADSLLNN